MTIFDSNLKDYVIKWEMIGEYRPRITVIEMKIQNQDGLDLGKFKFELNEFRTDNFSVLDVDGNTVLEATQKWYWKSWFCLMDSQRKELGILKRKGIWKRLDVFLTMNKDEVLIAKSDRLQTGKINDTQDKIIAEFSTEKVKTGRGVLKAPLFKTTHNLKILDESYDRKVLIGFFSYILQNLLPHPEPKER